VIVLEKCFAYREGRARWNSCSILKTCDCEECPFYKTYEQNEREQAEARIRAKQKGYYVEGEYKPKG
jgi:hypothetical protein